MSTKIGILTLPYNANYGGVLQTYALQTFLKRQGYQTVHLYRQFPEKNKPILYLKDCIKYILRKNKKQRTKSQKIKKSFDFLIHPRTKGIRTQSDFSILKKERLTTIIVGSDQVWRKACAYGPLLQNYFLDFADDSITKISYAASFGVDYWEYDTQVTHQLISLIKQFKAVSVRESSGIELCKEYLQTQATQVLDPTMLLTIEDYLQIMPKRVSNNTHSIAAYILDNNLEKEDICQFIQDYFHSELHIINKNTKHYISIPEWLADMYNASYIITDSFHGSVFAILFNKPFIAISNKNRGATRFDSILQLFNLESRMISEKSNANIEQILAEPINWIAVNKKLDEQRKASISFLKENIR